MHSPQHSWRYRWVRAAWQTAKGTYQYTAERGSSSLAASGPTLLGLCGVSGFYLLNKSPSFYSVSASRDQAMLCFAFETSSKSFSSFCFSNKIEANPRESSSHRRQGKHLHREGADPKQPSYKVSEAASNECE